MLEFLKRLLGLDSKVEPAAAPYKVEAPASVPLVSQPLNTTNLLYTPKVSPVVEPAPAVAAAPAQVAKKAATGTGKSMAKKGAEAGVKTARRRKKPAAT